jgi:hypothetical protein
LKKYKSPGNDEIPAGLIRAGGTIYKNKGTLIDASKEVGLERNVEKTKCVLLFRHQNADQNCDIKIANRKCVIVQILGD